MSNPDYELLLTIPEPHDDFYVDLDGVEIFDKICIRLLAENRLYRGHVRWLSEWVKTLRGLHLKRIGRRLTMADNDHTRKLFNRTRRDLIKAMEKHISLNLEDLQEMGIDIPLEV